jgi:hypothetical protein
MGSLATIFIFLPILIINWHTGIWIYIDQYRFNALTSHYAGGVNF